MSVTEEEKIKLANRVGPDCKIIASALVKLYLSSPNPQAKVEDDPILASFPSLSSNEWTFTHIVGFYLLVSDHRRDGLYLRVYDFKKLQRRFEYEIYLDMDYRMLDPQFHAFEIENCVVGVSFSVKSDGMQFLQKMLALRPSNKDSAATILRKMRAATLAKNKPKTTEGEDEEQEHDETKQDEPGSAGFVNCTPEQVKLLKEYQEARKKYEQDMARYKAEQEALKKYEAEKRAYEQKYHAFLRANEWSSEGSTNSDWSSVSKPTQ